MSLSNPRIQGAKPIIQDEADTDRLWLTPTQVATLVLTPAKVYETVP